MQKRKLHIAEIVYGLWVLWAVIRLPHDLLSGMGFSATMGYLVGGWLFPLILFLKALQRRKKVE